MHTLPEENVKESAKNTTTAQEKLPMPDSRCLDARVLKLINLIDNINQKKSLPHHVAMAGNSPGLKNQAFTKRLCHYLGVSEYEKNLLQAPFGGNTSTMNR